MIAKILKALFFGFVVVVAFGGCADLVPATPPNGDTLFCQRGSGGSHLLVYVKNKGLRDAFSSEVEVTFYVDGSTVKVRAEGDTGHLDAGETSEGLPVKIPAGCFGPDCNFDIMVDIDDDLKIGVKSTAILLAQGTEVPDNGPEANISLLSGPRGSAPLPSSSKRYLIPKPAPPI